MAISVFYVIGSFVFKAGKVQMPRAFDEYFRFDPFSKVLNPLLIFFKHSISIGFFYGSDGFHSGLVKISSSFFSALFFGTQLLILVVLVRQSLFSIKNLDNDFSKKTMFCGIAITIIAFAPFLGYRPIAMPMYCLYLPSFGFALFVGVVIFKLNSFFVKRWFKEIFSTTIALILGLQMLIIIGRSQIYLDEISQWAKITQGFKNIVKELHHNKPSVLFMGMEGFDKQLWYTRDDIPAVDLSHHYHVELVSVSTFLSPYRNKILIDENSPRFVSWDEVYLVIFDHKKNQYRLATSVDIQYGDKVINIPIKLARKQQVEPLNIGLIEAKIYGPYVRNPRSRRSQFIIENLLKGIRMRDS